MSFALCVAGNAQCEAPHVRVPFNIALIRVTLVLPDRALWEGNSGILSTQAVGLTGGGEEQGIPVGTSVAFVLQGALWSEEEQSWGP